jgi:hypothetical protein
MVMSSTDALLATAGSFCRAGGAGCATGIVTESDSQFMADIGASCAQATGLKNALYAIDNNKVFLINIHRYRLGDLVLFRGEVTKIRKANKPNKPD